MKKIIHSSKAPEPIGPYSQAILCNDTLYVSGQLGINPETGEIVNATIKEEAGQALQNVNAIVEQAGFTMEDVVKCTLYLRDMGQFAEVNEVYTRFFNTSKPARETVEVSRLPKNGNFEISVIAVKEKD